MIIAYCLFVARHKTAFSLFLLALFCLGTYHYQQITDNNSVYEMLNIAEDADRYYIQQYSPDFGKDEYIYVAFDTDDVFAAKTKNELQHIHQLLEDLTVEFDLKTGELIWPEDSERPFSEKLRHALKPYTLDVEWTGRVGHIKPSSAELRKEDLSIQNLTVQQIEKDGKTIGVIPVTQLVYSIHNLSFLTNADAAPTPATTKALWIQHPLTASLLFSNMANHNDKTGEESFTDSENALMVVAQIQDFKNRDELRQAITTKIRNGLKALRSETQNTYHLAGIPILNAETTRTVSNDHFHREPLVFAFIVGTLLYLLRKNSKAIVFPLGVIAASLMMTLGLFEIYGGEFNWLTAILPLMITITSLSDSVHMIEYFREEVPNSLPLHEKIAETVKHNWIPCLYTCATNITGMISLVLWKESPRPLIFFGLFCTLGFVITLIITYTLFPLTAQWLAPSSSVYKIQNSNSLWLDKIFSLSLQHHNKVMLGLVLLLPIIWFGMNKIRTTVDVLHYFDESTVLGADLAWIDDHFRGLGTGSFVFTETPSAVLAKATLPALRDDTFSKPLEITLSQHTLNAMRQTLNCANTGSADAKDCGWQNVMTDGVPSLSFSSNTTFLQLLPDDFHSNDPQEILNALAQLATFDETANRFLRFFFSRDGNKKQILYFVHAASSEPINTLNEYMQHDLDTFCTDANNTKTCTAILSGIGRVWNQMTQRLTVFLKKSFTSATFGILLIMMLFFFPHIDLSFLSLLPNLIPTMLILSLVGFSGTPFDMSTAMVASVALGLLVDDSMHLLYFFKEELERTQDFDHAVRYAFNLSGRAVITMSLVLGAGFLILSIGTFMPVVRVGRLLQTIILTGLIFELIVTPSLLFALYKPWWLRKKKTHPTLSC